MKSHINFDKLCYDFIKSMPQAKTAPTMYALIQEYRRYFPKYILEQCEAECFSAFMVSSLLCAIRQWTKVEVGFSDDVYGDTIRCFMEETLQFNFKNAQREWKRHGNNFLSSKAYLSVAYVMEGIRKELSFGTHRGGIDCYNLYFGMKIIEFVLLMEQMPFIMEQEEQKHRLREEEKALRELQREKEQAEKDAAKAQAAIKKNEAALTKAKTEAQVKKLQAQIEELKIALQRAEERRDRAISMAQQTRCGYVYIISNIGSFGEGIYKIGMTRRIDPMMRVHELGSASVPFPFDVHAMIYTEDAPGLEAHLHKVFDRHKVNAVNWRKEYFRVPLEEIRKEVENFGISCQWMNEPAAEQFRESEWMYRVGLLDYSLLDDFIQENPKEFAQRNRSFEYDPFDIMDDE